MKLTFLGSVYAILALSFSSDIVILFNFFKKENIKRKHYLIHYVVESWFIIKTCAFVGDL